MARFSVRLVELRLSPAALRRLPQPHPAEELAPRRYAVNDRCTLVLHRESTRVLPASFESRANAVSREKLFGKAVRTRSLRRQRCPSASHRSRSSLFGRARGGQSAPTEQTRAVHPPSVARQVRQTLEHHSDGSSNHCARLKPDSAASHRCPHLRLSPPITVRATPHRTPDRDFRCLRPLPTPYGYTAAYRSWPVPVRCSRTMGASTR